MVFFIRTSIRPECPELNDKVGSFYRIRDGDQHHDTAISFTWSMRGGVRDMKRLKVKRVIYGVRNTSLYR